MTPGFHRIPQHKCSLPQNMTFRTLKRSPSRCECFISSFQLYGGNAETQGNAGLHVREQYSKFLCKGPPAVKTTNFNKWIFIYVTNIKKQNHRQFRNTKLWFLICATTHSESINDVLSAIRACIFRLYVVFKALYFVWENKHHFRLPPRCQWDRSPRKVPEERRSNNITIKTFVSTTI
jgi:hypothetical protein